MIKCLICPAPVGPGYIYFDTRATGRNVRLTGGLCEACSVRLWKRLKTTIPGHQFEVTHAENAIDPDGAPPRRVTPRHRPSDA